MRLLALNVKGLGQTHKIHEVISYLRYEKVHLALVTETHMTPDRLEACKGRPIQTMVFIPIVLVAIVSESCLLS